MVNKKRTKAQWTTFIVTILLTLIMHYLTFAKLNIHPTWNVLITLFLFMTISTVTYPIIKRIIK